MLERKLRRNSPIEPVNHAVRLRGRFFKEIALPSRLSALGIATLATIHFTDQPSLSNLREPVPIVVTTTNPQTSPLDGFKNIAYLQQENPGENSSLDQKIDKLIDLLTKEQTGKNIINVGQGEINSSEQSTNDLGEWVAAAIILGLSIAPLRSAGRAGKTFFEGGKDSFLAGEANEKNREKFKKSLKVKVKQVKEEYINSPHAQWIAARTVAVLTAVSDIRYGLGRIDLPTTFISGALFAALLFSFRELTHSEKPSAVALEGLGKKILGIASGLTIGEQLVRQSGEMPPHVLLAFYIGYSIMKHFATFAHQSRGHQNDIGELHVIRPPTLEKLLAELKTNGYADIADNILVALGTNQHPRLVQRGGLVEDAIATLELSRTGQPEDYTMTLDEMVEAIRLEMANQLTQEALKREELKGQMGVN